MLPPATPAISRAIEAAGRRAAARGAAEAGAVDLLGGLLDEEDGRAASLTRAAGLDLDAHRAAGPAPAADQRAVGLGGPAEALLFAAREAAFDLTGEGVITSEALLVALLRQGRDAFAALAALGLDLDRLEADLAGQRPAAPVIDVAFHLADLTERMDTARILDAAGNRAREALRTLEDYARFALDDALLSGECKRARHDLTTALLELGPPELVWARETQHDVGTATRAEGEYERDSLRGVVAANLQRLQEALRSLEEFAKVGRPVLAQRLEQLRYRSYTIERALLIGGHARGQLDDVRLCALLSGAACQAALDWTIAEAAAGGVGMVQLREKDLPDRALVERARQVRGWTRKAGVLFIVNDRVDVARLAEADGVHLGQDDLSVKDARRLLGPEALIGVSTHDVGQVRRAVLDGASYLGVGPVFSSRTKAFESLAGLAFVRAAVAETGLPAFAIGGIDAGTIGAVVAAGARRVAVGQAVAAADDPRRAAAELLAALAAGV